MATTTRKTSKLFIPHTQEEGINIAGVLEQVEPDQGTKGRRIALILHGLLGHKDYLFQKRLALQLPIDSFRFDFRGNFETPGSWSQGALGSDLVDLQVVVAYLTSHFGYRIDLVVGHSRGSIVAFRWMCTAEEAKTVSGFVNLSARYRMQRVYIDSVPKYAESFERVGYYDWALEVARKPVVARIYPKDMDEFANWDTSLVWNRFPSNTHVLTMHGIKDNVVPVYDAVIYARALGSRASGTHNLCLVEDGDHNHSGKFDLVVETILEWLGKLDREGLHTGIWNTGIEGKL